MKERIIAIIAYLSLLFLIVSITLGINLKIMKISSASQMKEKNEEVIAKLNETEKVVTVDYPKTITTLENDYSEYSKQKKRYFELTGISNESADKTYETKQYDITYLWKKIGSYATNKDLKIGIDVQKNTSSLYDLNFTLKGAYTDISDFIVAIEDDSEFSFRIYNYKMVGTGGKNEELQANFSIKNISIDPSTISQTANISAVEKK